MGKIVFFFTLFCILANAQDVKAKDKQQFDKVCLACHAKQQIPDALVYRRYLMQYSTFERMQKEILAYLKKPDQKHSIMPPQFFLKFPMKEASPLDDDTLEKMVRQYLNTFDIKKKLVLPR